MTQKWVDRLVIVVFSVLGVAFIGLLLYALSGGAPVKPERGSPSRDLQTMSPQNVSIFRIYHAQLPAGEPVNFSNDSPLVQEFFHALQDMKPYLPQHDAVEGQNSVWFLEVYAKSPGDLRQIQFIIPANTNTSGIVVGEFGKWTEKSQVASYEMFRSRKLYQWYLAYRALWIKPR